MDKNVKYITSLSRVEYVQLLIALSTRIDYLMNMIAGLPSDEDKLMYDYFNKDLDICMSLYDTFGESQHP